jgi:pyruvyltransferase
MNFFKKLKSFKNKKNTKIFWCDCNCNCPDIYPKFDYNPNICSSCIGIKDKTKQNFGDLITSYIFTKIHKNPPTRSDDKNSLEPVIFGSGSMMNLCNEWDNVIVWGTGIIHSKDVFEKPTQILAVRGPLTHKRFLELGYDCPKIYGDIALLLPKFYRKPMIKKYEIGIIPHYVDYEFCKKQFSNLDGVLVIDVCEDVEIVIDNIRKCERTISSSLHGIIVSHAYGIKSCWIKLSNFVYGDDVKFLDYYFSQDLTTVQNPISLEALQSSLDNMDNLINLIEKYPNPKFPIDTSELLETCPF